MGNLWLGHINCGKIFLFALAVEGPSVSEPKNLFKSTFLFLYGNPNLCLRNKVRSHYASKKHKNGINTEISTFFESGKGNSLCSQLVP